MVELICTLIVAAIFGSIGYSLGLEQGQVSVYRGEVACQTLIDGAVRCVPKERVKP